MARKVKNSLSARFQQASVCEAKRRFATKKLADDAADYQMLIKPNLELTTYACGNCGGWHLTRTTNSI